LAPLPEMGAMHLALTSLAVIAFIAAGSLQVAAPQLAASGRWQSLRYALANGLYAHTLFDRALAAFSPKSGVKA
jgi:hypothetical protein